MAQGVCMRFNLILFVLVLVLVLEIRISYGANDEHEDDDEDEAHTLHPRLELHKNDIGFIKFHPRIEKFKVKGSEVDKLPPLCVCKP